MSIWRNLIWIPGVSCNFAAETFAPGAEVLFTCKLHQEISCRETCMLPPLSVLRPCGWVQVSDHVVLVEPNTGFDTEHLEGSTCLSSRLKLLFLNDHRFLWNRIVFSFSIAQTTVIKSLYWCLATDYCKGLSKIQGCIRVAQFGIYFRAQCVSA